MGLEDFDIDSDEHSEQVLIIGESKESATKLSMLLGKRGYRSLHSPSVDEASKMASQQLFDLVICDDSLANFSPEQLIHKIQSDSCLRRAPLLVLHPSADSQASISAAEVGSDVQILPTPFQPGAFLVKVATQLRLRKFNHEQVGFEARIATQNAELRDLTNRFKRELKEARTIQQSILPKELPEAEKTIFAAYCVPLEAVGGDLFDVFKIDEQRIGLFIGDVTGHGLPAAFIGAMTKMALSYSTKDDPARMLTEMNDGICDLMPEGRFVTVAAAIYDAATGDFLVARGGHPPPYIWRAASGEVEEFSPKGLPLGIMKGAPYALEKTRLEPGDKMLMVTDGLTETSDMDGNMLGVDGVGELFGKAAAKNSIDQCIQLVLNGQKEFSQGRSIKDDNSLLGLERLL